jgi:hypothetical protein
MMFAFMGKTNILKRLFIAFTAFFFIFTITTCDTPMGMGDSIDWEPPVLTLVPKVPNPMYVSLGTKITGTVTDNGKVDRVIMRDSLTGVEIFRAALSGENWEIVMSFTTAQNGEKIAAEIVAYDKFGNSGSTSIAQVTLIVDIRKPIIDDIWIQRTKLRTSDLEPYPELFKLEASDPRGERNANVNRYQNGNFYLYATISEDETRIDEEKGVKLNIYEQAEPNVPLLTIDKDPGTSTFSPRWLIREEDILTAGEARSLDYITRYDNGERFYYRVQVVAYDRSENQSDGLPRNYVEDQGFFVLWKTADAPKGILDPLVVGSTAETETVIATRGSTLPVEFFDDDSVKWAYAGLLTEEQWNGAKPVGDGLTITGATDELKLEWLRTTLQADGLIYNWKYDIYSGTSAANSEKIINQVTTSDGIDQKIYYVQTGNNDSDNGQFVLFTLTGDHKLEPHPVGTDLDTHVCRAYKVSVVDENAPMIVFDINGGSPEENTFPKLTNGRYFTIKGYTLRAINGNLSQDVKKVTRFRMAWIPYYINDRKPDELIEAVQKELESDEPEFINALDGVQWWDFQEEGFEFGKAASVLGTDDLIGIQHYRKQTFYKTFDVLGGKAANKTTGTRLAGSSLNPIILRNDPANVYASPPSLSPPYNPPAAPIIKNEPHFIYNMNGVDQLENETKLFVFYAEDNMDHKVHRQIRLLGNKAPPEIFVYDITGRTINALVPPDINASILAVNPQNPGGNDPNKGIVNAAVRQHYQSALNGYQTTGYNAISASVSSEKPTEIAQELRTYPRGAMLKYYVMAQEIDNLFGVLIESISMEDRTYDPPVVTGHYNGTDALSYCETLPEVTQRTFLFTATDTLGNQARIQRTVSITNAAMLTEINTVSQDGTYGIGTTITLRAVFSNQVYWTSGTDNIRPRLVVSYKKNNAPEIIEIPTNTPKDTNTLFLDFPFTVTAGDSGQLLTMYDNSNTSSLPNTDEQWSYNATQWNNIVSNMQNRPIMFLGSRNSHGSGEGHYNCSHIYDAERNDNAFTPGNVSGFEWSDRTGSLQASKVIMLDGTAPTVSSFTLTGRTAGTYYYKTNETISFTLTASESIETAAVSPTNSSSIPRIQFQIQPPTGATPAQLYYADWERSSGSNGMIFSVTVSSTIPDGTVVNPALNYTNGRITDINGNALAQNSSIALPAGTVLRIDKTPPPAPAPTLGGLSGTPAPAAPTTYYNYNPRLVIPAAPAVANEPWGVSRIDYSLDNGNSWAEFSPNSTAIPDKSMRQSTGEITIRAGTYTLRTRYVDLAGNITTTPSTHTININTSFPKLVSVNAVSPNGTYKTGNLSFNLLFEDSVHTQGAAGTPTVTITLTNRAASNNNNPGPNGTITNSYTVTLNATAIPTNNPTNTVSFVFPVSNKEMLNGLYISNIDLRGLSDRYGNMGSNVGTVPFNAGTNSPINMSSYTVSNLNGSGIIVDCIAPRVTAMVPGNANGLAATARQAAVSTDNRTIRITFNEPVMKSSGTITIKPHGDYFIPPVFENEGYYIDQSGNRYTSPGNNRTYVNGMSDVFNNVNIADKTTLIGGTSMSSPPLDARTGQTVGPYIRMTHGLRTGVGYTGNYNNSMSGDEFTAGTIPNGPNPLSASMVPDTATKWVLDYRYSINNTTNTSYIPATNNTQTPTGASNTVVPAIRDVLNRAKFRWQEIDVRSDSVTLEANGTEVVITLPEPLLKGLQWDLEYNAGTFTDVAGNDAPACPNAANTFTASYWFLSSGAQTPVIRVNRKSYDARIRNWQEVTSNGTNATGKYSNPNSQTGADAPAGWSISNFETVHYRIETETPDAQISYGIIDGRTVTVPTNISIGSAYVRNDNTIDFDVAVPDAGSATDTTGTGWLWTRAGNDGSGLWVRPNLIRRARNGGTYSWTVTENGATVSRPFSGNNRSYRSYNKDALVSDLTGLPLGTSITSSVSSGTALSFSYYPTEARKDYVAAVARVNHNGSGWTQTGDYMSDRGYEGVFRSVVALYITTPNATSPVILVEGSNIKNGMPSVAGFPVRDAEESGDNRFIKYFYRNASSYYWVSTEIVSQWFFLAYGNNATHMAIGEVNNYLTAGYGDLTFGLDQR